MLALEKLFIDALRPFDIWIKSTSFFVSGYFLHNARVAQNPLFNNSGVLIESSVSLTMFFAYFT